MADENILAIAAVAAGAYLISKKNKKDSTPLIENNEAAQKVASSLKESAKDSIAIPEQVEEPTSVDDIKDVEESIPTAPPMPESIVDPIPQEVIDAAMEHLMTKDKPKPPKLRRPVFLPKMDLSFISQIPKKTFTASDRKRYPQISKIESGDFTWTRDGDVFGININLLKTKAEELESNARVEQKKMEILEGQTFTKSIRDEILALGQEARNLVKAHQNGSVPGGTFFYREIYDYAFTDQVINFAAGFGQPVHDLRDKFKQLGGSATVYSDTFLNWEKKQREIQAAIQEAKAAHAAELEKPLDNQAEIDRLYEIYKAKRTTYYSKRSAYYANKTDANKAALDSALAEMNTAINNWQAERDKPRSNQAEIDRLYATIREKIAENVAHINLRRELGLYGLEMYSDEYRAWRDARTKFYADYKAANPNWTRESLKEAVSIWQLENPTPTRYIGLTKEEAAYFTAVNAYLASYALSLIPADYKTRFKLGTFQRQRVIESTDAKRLLFKEKSDEALATLEKFYGGGFNKSQALDDMAASIAQIQAKASDLRDLYNYGQKLINEETEFEALSTMLHNNFSPYFSKELKNIVHDFQIDLWQNEMRSASEKALRYPDNLTNEQIEYLIGRSFCVLRLDLAKRLQEVIMKYRYTDESIIEGVPAEFMRWVNLTPTKDNRGTTESGILKMLVLLYKYKPVDKAEKFMKDEILKKQKAHINLYPDYPLNFEKLKIQAQYLLRTEKYKDRLRSYFPDRIRELETEYYTKKIQAFELGQEVDIDSGNLSIAEQVKEKLPLYNYIQVAERFFFTKEEIDEDVKIHQEYLDHFHKILADVQTKDDPESIEQALFIENAMLPYFKNTLYFKKQFYSTLVKQGRELIKEQELQAKLVELENAIANNKYVGEVFQDGTKTKFKSNFVPTKEFQLPIMKGKTRYYDDRNFLLYPRVLLKSDLNQLINSPNNPLDVKTTKLLLSNIDDYPMDTMEYLDIYIKLASKAQEIADRFKRRGEFFGQNPEFAFMNLLYFFLLTKIRTKIDIRSMFDVNDLGEIGTFKYDRDPSGKPVRTFHPKIYNNVINDIKRIEAFHSSDSYDQNWIWKKLIANFEPSKFKRTDLLNNNVFTDAEILVLKHSFVTSPTPQVIIEYANEKDLTIREAIANMDKYVIPVLAYMAARLHGNINLDHDDWIRISPIGRELAGKYSAVKYQMLKAEKTAVDGIFNSYIDYLEYYEKHGTDEGWEGSYAYLFKKDSPRFSDRLSSLPDLNEYDSGTMDGLLDDIGNVFKKAVKVVKSPLEKAQDAAKSVVKGATKKVISPVTGTVKESLTQLQRGQILEAIKTTQNGLVKDMLIKRLNNAMSELEEAAIKPAGRLLKKGTYALIPRSAFQAFNRLTKIPEHLVKGDLDKVDFRAATVDILQATSGALFVTRIAGEQFGKGINSLTKNVTFFEKLDIYSGGLLTSTANISTVMDEVADGQEIDKQYLLMKSIDAAKVGAVAVSFGTAGPIVAGVGLATQVTTNAVMAETDWVEDEKTRMALSIVAAAAASYAASAASATQGAGQIAAEAGTGAAASAGTGAGAGVAAGAASAGAGAATQVATQTTVKMTFGEALKQAAINESKSYVSKEAAKQILKESGMSDSEIAALAVGIGVTATVAVISNSDKKWSEEVITRAKKTAIAQSEKRADKELKKIDPNLSVDKLKKLYDIAQGDVEQIIEEKKERFKQYVQSGELAEDAKAETERWAKREAKKRLEKQYAKYEDEFLDYLMERYGVQADYDKFITPETYLEYSNYIILLEEKRDVIIVEEIIRKRNTKKKVAVGVAAVAAAFAFSTLAGE